MKPPKKDGRALGMISKKEAIDMIFNIEPRLHEKVAMDIRYIDNIDSANIKTWIVKSKAHGLNVCGHLIFGLPGETKEMMLHTAKEAYSWEIDAVKYHPLYVVKRTALANEYARGEFRPISEEDYIDVLVQAIRMKPENVNVQRITAGIDDDSLIAPDWCRDKNAQVRHINAALKQVGLKY